MLNDIKNETNTTVQRDLLMDAIDTTLDEDLVEFASGLLDDSNADVAGAAYVVVLNGDPEQADELIAMATDRIQSDPVFSGKLLWALMTRFDRPERRFIEELLSWAASNEYYEVVRDVAMRMGDFHHSEDTLLAMINDIVDSSDMKSDLREEIDYHLEQLD